VRVKAIEWRYWRVVGEVENLRERVARTTQGWFKRLGIARRLAKAD